MAQITPEQVRQPISEAELSRRWSGIRKGMNSAGIDCLVTQGNNEWLGGYVRWFTDIPPSNSYPVTVVFPANEEMTVISSGPSSVSAPLTPIDRGIKSRISLPYFLSLNYTNTMDAEATVGILKARGDKRVGVVGKGFMPASFYEYLKENLPGVEIVDATNMVDEFKAVKSAEEVELIKGVAWLHDTAFAALPTLIRPGKKEYEIRSAIQHLLVDMGSEEQLIMIGSAPQNQRAGHKPPFQQNRTLREGDLLFVMLEVNGLGGFYGEVGRTFSLGDPSKELLDAWEVAREAQKHTASMLRPGARPADIFRSHNQFMESHGYPPETRIYAHAQGYDLVERPAIREEETITLKANMNIAVHPLALTNGAYAFCCDNYLVGEAETVRLSKTPQEILVV